MKTNIIENLFFHILTFSFLIPILALLFHYKTLRSEGVFIAIFTYCISIMTMLYFDEYLSSKYRHLYTTFYTTAEYVVFSYIIWFFIVSRILKIIIAVLAVSFITFQVAYYFLAKFNAIDSIPIGIETILLIIQVLFVFYEQLQRPVQHFYETPSFWFVSGIMLYLFGSFFFNILANSSAYRPIIERYWSTTYILETIKNILFAVAILIYAKHSAKNNHEKNDIPNLDMLIE